MSYFRPNIEAMTGYVPGEQPPAGQQVIKLNTNENPYPPSPQALAVLRQLDGELLRRYSQPLATTFRQAVGEALGVRPDWVLAGNGSDDLLTMLFRACTGPGRAVVCPAPTYTLYRTLAQIQEAPYAEVPFGADYRLPLDALAARQGALTLVANPNSPSGTRVPPDELAELARRLEGVLVVDEAYADFADVHALDLPTRHENVIVLRTLSKGYGLAGLRLGFGVARPALLHGLLKVKDSYNVDAVACAVGAAAMRDQPYKTACAAKVVASRQRLADGLAALGFTFPPSQANFLLARPPAGEAERLYEALKARGILVRYFREPALADKLRITVGTDEQNDALLAALREILAAGRQATGRPGEPPPTKKTQQRRPSAGRS